MRRRVVTAPDWCARRRPTAGSMECSHKVLLMGLHKNEPVIKYGEEIGRMKCDACIGARLDNGCVCTPSR